MIEISFGKLLVLALIALIVLGPEKLPQAARTAGALVRRLRGSWDSVRAEVERELQVEEIRRTARESVARMDAAQAELDATLKQVREVASGTADSGGASPAAAAALVGDGHPGTADQSGVNSTAAAVADQATTIGADQAAASADTHTGDLFAGTASAAPPASAATAAPAERIDGAA